MRNFIKIGEVRVEPDRIVSYEVQDLDNNNYGIHYYYDGEFDDFRGWRYVWFHTGQERHDALLKLDMIFVESKTVKL
jgi:hypothetical protein